MTSDLHITAVIYGFVMRVFIFTLDNNSYLRSDRLFDAWLSYWHWELFTATFQSFPLFLSSSLRALFHGEILTQTMCLKSANRHPKLIITLEKLSFDFTRDKIGSCLKYFRIS